MKAKIKIKKNKYIYMEYLERRKKLIANKLINLIFEALSH